MDPLAFFLSLLFVSPFLIFLTHGATVRAVLAFRINVQPLMTGVLAVGIAFLFVFLISWVFFLRGLEGRALWSAGLYGILTYLGFAFCYFQVFAMTETARRLHILHELYTKGDMTMGRLDAEYGASRMMAVRIARMVEIGQLKYEDGHYKVRGGLLLWVGRIMFFWAKVLGFKK